MDESFDIIGMDEYSQAYMEQRLEDYIELPNEIYTQLNSVFRVRIDPDTKEYEVGRGLLSSTSCPTCGFPSGTPGWLSTSDLPSDHKCFGSLIRCPDCNLSELPNSLIQKSGLDGWMSQVTLSSFNEGGFNEGVVQSLHDWACKPKNWLCLSGEHGSGKSHLVSGIVREATANRIPTLYFTLTSLIDKLQNSVRQTNEYDDVFNRNMEKILSSPILVIDEFDQFYNWTPWAYQTVSRLLDSRYRMVGIEGYGTVFVVTDNPRNHTKGVIDSPVMDHARVRFIDRRNKHFNIVKVNEY